MLPGSFHDLTPIYEVTVDLLAGVALYGDKRYNYGDSEELLALDGLRLIPLREKNMELPTWADEYDLRPTNA